MRMVLERDNAIKNNGCGTRARLCLLVIIEILVLFDGCSLRGAEWVLD